MFGFVANPLKEVDSPIDRRLLFGFFYLIFRPKVAYKERGVIVVESEVSSDLFLIAVCIAIPA